MKRAAANSIGVDEGRIRRHLIEAGRALDTGHPAGGFGIRFVEDIGEVGLAAVIRAEAHEFGADLPPRVIVATHLKHGAEHRGLAGGAEGNGAVEVESPIAVGWREVLVEMVVIPTTIPDGSREEALGRFLSPNTIGNVRLIVGSHGHRAGEENTTLGIETVSNDIDRGGGGGNRNGLTVGAVPGVAVIMTGEVADRALGEVGVEIGELVDTETKVKRFMVCAPSERRAVLAVNTIARAKDGVLASPRLIGGFGPHLKIPRLFFETTASGENERAVGAAH